MWPLFPTGGKIRIKPLPRPAGRSRTCAAGWLVVVLSNYYDTSTLAALLRDARDGEHGLLLAGTTDDLKSVYRGFTVDALRSRSGLLLAPQAPEDGDLFGIRLPRNTAASGPAGRALLILAGNTEPIQIALP
jgi:hypothetical protein